jgi:hypothetical protein
MPQNPRQNEITELLKENGAVAVIEDINDIEILVRQAGSSGRN